MGNPTEAPGDDAAPPPPYTAVDTTALATPPYEAGSGAGIPSAGAGAVAGVSNRFPPSFNAYFEMKFLSKIVHLGEHADSPLFAVATRSGWSGKPLLSLHAGPSDAHPVIATAGPESRWSTGRRSVVQILPAALHTEPGSSSGGSASGSSSAAQADPQPVATVEMTEKQEGVHTRYSFAADVGLGKELRREEFEWRSSGGEEVRELDKRSRGWKLVRVGSAASGQGGGRGVRSAGATSDGKEVVAVWSANGSVSKNKAFKFQFLRSGAAGVLGDRFALVAVMTAMKIWYSALQASSSSAGAAGGA